MKNPHFSHLMTSRKVLFTCLFCLFTLGLSAQSILNGGFENNVIVGIDTVPEHWSMDPNGSEISSNAHSGNQAISIWNWYYYAEGWATYGSAQNEFEDGGHPVSINPSTLSGWYQYILGDNGGASDSAICQIYVYSYQNFAGTRDTIASGRMKLGPATSYQFFNIPIIYNSFGINADTVVIKFSSSENGFCSSTSDGNCLYLFIDDLQLSTILGATESLDAEASLKMYPSPSRNGFRVFARDEAEFPMKVELLDLTGKLISTENVKNGDQVVGATVPPGHYIWRMHTAEDKVQSGRLSVE